MHIAPFFFQTICMKCYSLEKKKIDWYFMQIDNMHELSKHIFSEENKKNISLLSAEWSWIRMNMF